MNLEIPRLPNVELARTRPLISIVVPVYNEETNVLPFHDAISAVVAPLESKYEFEFVFTDNHSEDATFPLLQDMARRDPRVRAYRFSRNFGFQRSIMTGYTKARGDAAIQMDVDLQDPPDLMGRFLSEWENGAEVGVRRAREAAGSLDHQRAALALLPPDRQAQRGQDPGGRGRLSPDQPTRDRPAEEL